MLGRLYRLIRDDCPEPEEFNSSYQNFRESAHVFIFGVLGRCSTTALQRILNSSGEITISGESKGIVAQLLQTLKALDNFQVEFHDNYDRFKQCFAKKKHTRVYSMALNTSECSKLIKDSLVALIKPLHGGSRLGFKDIEAGSIADLEVLKELFPGSKFVFLFRDPIPQFQSVQALDYWDYSKSIDLFIEKYVSLSDLYIRFYKKERSALFLENTALYELQKVESLLEKLSISNFDEALIGDSVFSAKSKTADTRRDSLIRNSKAYEAFVRLRQLANEHV